MAYSCSFTGHRIIKNTHKARLGELTARAIAYAYDKGCRNFYTGGALGFDTLAAEEVLRFKSTHPDVRLCLVLPCRDQEKPWSDADKAVYKRIMEEADTAEYVNESYHENCMKERNARLVELCDILIAYVGKKMGGAAQTLRMAQRAEKERYNLYPSLEGEA